MKACFLFGENRKKIDKLIYFMKTNPQKKMASNTIVKMTAVFTALILSVESLCAVGYRLPNQDPEAIARGDAFTATADDPSAIYYNPAGITQLPGLQANAGLYFISADTTFSSPAGSAKTATTPQLVPQLYATYALTNLPLSFGLGVYAPYGLALNYGNTSPFNTVAEQGSLLYATINPVVAWKVTPTLSVAIGPDISLSQLELQQAIPFDPATRFNYAGEGWDAGYNAGILWQPDPMWAFGVNYRSSTRITYRGKSEQNFGAPFPASTASSVTVPFPEDITGGISFRPTPKWNFEFDLDWTKWSEVKSATISSTPFGTPATLTLDFQNSFIYEFGVTRQLWAGYFASVGYEYSENSSPSANYTPIIPDGNLNLGGVGFGHRGQRWDWMAAFQFAYGTRTVSGDNNATADGNYKTFNKAINLSATYKF
jgi:long-chain fatty acid transport protein